MGIFTAIDNFFSDIHGAFIVGRTNDALKKLQKELDKLPDGATISRPKPTKPIPDEAEPINKGPVKTSSEKVPEPEDVVAEVLQPEETKQPETVIVEEQPVQEEANLPEKKPEEEAKKPKQANQPEPKKKPENQKKPKQAKKPDPVQEETKKSDPEPVKEEAKQQEPEPVQEQPKSKPNIEEPEKKPEPAKTQHTESLNMQMGDIDAILNNKRRSRKVAPPGGGVGSAIKK